jgi:HAE1 family hydrophobic/amphiphilic exporter-1
MAFAILVSLLVSFTLTPMLGARWLKVKRHGADRHASKDARVFHAVDVAYTRMLEWSMAHRAIVAGVAVLVLLSSVPLFMMAPKNFMPQDDQAEFEINLRAPEGTSLESTEVTTNRIAAVSAGAGSRVHVGNNRWRPVEDAQPGVCLRASPTARRARDQFAVMGTAQRDSAAARRRSADLGPAGRDGRRRRQPERRCAVPRQRTDLRVLEHISQELVERAKSFSGVVDATRRSRSASRSSPSRSIAPRRRTSASRSPTPPTPSGCWSAATR